MKEEYGKLIENYKEHLTREKRSIRQLSSIKDFAKYLDGYDIELLHVRPGEAEQYQGYLLTKKDENGNAFYCARSVQNIIGRLSSFYDYLVKRDLALYNPFKGISRIKAGKSLPKNILDEDKLNTLLDALKEKISTGKNLDEKRLFYRIHVLAELMYSTGARINEVVKLTEDDIDLVRGTVILRDDKTGKERCGFLNSYICELLQVYLENRDLISTASSNKELLFNSKARLSRNFNREIQKLCDNLKYGDFKSHNIRHCFGFHLLRAGCDIRYIQEFLGHTRLSTTQIYTRIDKFDLRNILDKYHPRKLHNEVV